MGIVLWHITMSLDGFIAGHGGDISWRGDYIGPNPAVDDVPGQFGVVLIGVHTYFGAKTEAGNGYEIYFVNHR